MRSPRSVTMHPIVMPARSLKAAMDLRALVITGRCPVISASSCTAPSISLGFWLASPRPMLTVIFSSRGTAMGFL
jgi:hypothetical protein